MTKRSMTPWILGGLLIAAVLVFKFVLSGPSMSPEQFIAERTDADLVIDVRSAGEYAGGHFAGARNMDIMGDFRSGMEGEPRDQRVFLYCASGTRSGRASAILKGMGFEEVYNVGSLGGLRAAGAEIES